MSKVLKGVGSKLGKKRNLVLFLFIIGIIGIGSVAIYYFYSGDGIGGDGGDGDGGSNIDVSFDQWTIAGNRPGQMYIKNMGTYIEIDSNVWKANLVANAQLDFNLAIEGTLKFRAKFFGASGAKFLLRHGTTIVFQLIGSAYTGRRVFRITGLPDITLIGRTSSSTWYDFEVSFKIDGDNSEVTVKVDGIVKINAQKFASSQLGINNIVYSPPKYYIAGCKTHLIWSSLVIN
ncbi:hypothetical protein LCGC14_0603170 [marine sediment metagenome]|uniref:Uncharacterized protein n=1 Tax=marine sediment metagenome TaxID=412755 RepID=A0A0F9RU03_9ZZZZ